MSELIEKLKIAQAVECSRPEKNAQSLEECINRNYVHVLFTKTNTEIGFSLLKDESNIEADFTNHQGVVSLVGVLTLDYHKVKCIAEIDIATCEGSAQLESLTEENYANLATSV